MTARVSLRRHPGGACVAMVDVPTACGAVRVSGVGDFFSDALGAAVKVAARIVDDPVMKAIMPPQATAAIDAVRTIAAAAQHGPDALDEAMSQYTGPGQRRLVQALQREQGVTSDKGRGADKGKAGKGKSADGVDRSRWDVQLGDVGGVTDHRTGGDTAYYAWHQIPGSPAQAYTHGSGSVAVPAGVTAAQNQWIADNGWVSVPGKGWMHQGVWNPGGAPRLSPHAQPPQRFSQLTAGQRKTAAPVRQAVAPDDPAFTMDDQGFVRRTTTQEQAGGGYDAAGNPSPTGMYDQDGNPLPGAYDFDADGNPQKGGGYDQDGNPQPGTPYDQQPSSPSSQSPIPYGYDPNQAANDNELFAIYGGYRDQADMLNAEDDNGGEA
jgi:hypothetical protein